MSLIRLLPVCLLLLAIVGCATAPAPEPGGMGGSFDVFYSNLSPHGTWLVSGSYGRVWQPAEYRPGWNPYYEGRWVYTDVGWTWVSNYEWGVVPYHYGTWVADADLGWVWVPGYVWAPSWVVFRTGPDYIGWAPVPVGYTVGMSIGLSTYSADSFVFVASRDFLSPRVGAYAVPASNRSVIINNTRIENTIRIENNVVINTGPDVNFVQRASGRRIEAESIENVPKVGPGRSVARGDLAVDAQRTGGRVRAAEPVSERDSESMIERGRPEPRPKDRRPPPSEPEDENPQREPRSPRFSGSGDPQAQPEADSRPQSDDSERGRKRAQQRDRTTPEPEAPPQQRNRRFSPSADPQMLPDSRSGQPSMDTEHDRDQSGEQQRMRPDNDQSRKNADAKAKAEVKEKEKAKKNKKQKPKPTPSDDKPPQH